MKYAVFALCPDFVFISAADTIEEAQASLEEAKTNAGADADYLAIIRLEVIQAAE